MPNNIRILKLQLNCLKTNTVWAEGSGKFLRKVTFTSFNFKYEPKEIVFGNVRDFKSFEFVFTWACYSLVISNVNPV